MKPILYNTEMVQAILKGQKAVTRRVVKPLVPEPCELRKMQEGYHAGEWHLYCENPLLDGPNRSPWGAQFTEPYQPGDILYVRETFVELPVTPDGKLIGGKPWLYYKADGDMRPPAWQGNWRPSIFMPKEAARLFLRVTDVRAERLQAIKERGSSSAHAEGFQNDVFLPGGKSATRKFAELWDSLIKPADRDIYGWDANPWVWVIEFERCEKPEEEYP